MPSFPRPYCKWFGKGCSSLLMELKFGEIFVTGVYLGCYAEAISLNRVLHKRVSVNLEPFT